MANKNVKTRVSNKYDMASNWEKATFIPMKGEFIVYAKEDIDEEGNVYERFAQAKHKTGDGVHTVNELPFDDEEIYDELEKRPVVYISSSEPANAAIGTLWLNTSNDIIYGEEVKF